MLGGVLAELASARLIARMGEARVLAVGLVLLGAPALMLLAADQFAVVVAVCLVRGLGFGLAMVAGGALVVSAVPVERRGEGLGVFGVVACVPGIVALPASVWLVDQVGYPPVFVLAAVTAIGPLAVRPGASQQPARAGVGRAVRQPARRPAGSRSAAPGPRVRGHHDRRRHRRRVPAAGRHLRREPAPQPCSCKH